MIPTVELVKEPTQGVTVGRTKRRDTSPSIFVRATDAIGRAVDSVIGIFAPRAAAERMALRGLLRGYDAANASRLTGNRRTSFKDADSELNGKMNRIRSFSREECRNNGFARNAKRSHKNNVIGDADTGQGVTVDAAVLNADGTPNEAVNRELARLWECYRDKLDLKGFWGFTDLCSVADHELFESGEVLGVFRDVGSLGSDLPFSIELIEADRLPMTSETLGLGPYGKYPVVNPDGSPGENWIRHGIEYDNLGRRVAYHICKDHPGNEYAFASVLQTTRFPVENVIHYFAPDRAGTDARRLPADRGAGRSRRRAGPEVLHVGAGKDSSLHRAALQGRRLDHAGGRFRPERRPRASRTPAGIPSPKCSRA